GPVLTLAGSFLELATNIRLTRAASGGLSATSVAGASGMGLAGAGALGAAAKVGGTAIAAGAVGYGIGTLINQHLPKLWGEDQHLSDILSGRNRAIDPTPTARELEVERQLAAAQARNRGGTMGPITVN